MRSLQSGTAWWKGTIPALVVSFGLHAAAGAAVLTIKVVEEVQPEWVEMVVHTPEPPPEPPPPEPEPEPEPEKPKPEKKKKAPPPEPVEFEETTAEPPPEAPPDKPKPRRLVQGLSASSFAEGSGTGVSARAGTTLSTKATTDTMGIDEAENWTDVPYASVTTKPKLKGGLPRIEVPQEAIDNEIEGTWPIIIDISEQGRVVKARMPQKAGYGIDEACLSAWKTTRWKPGERDGTPVSVVNIPMKCTIQALD